MRFLLMHRVPEGDNASWEPTPELVKRMGEFAERLTAQGVLLGAEGVHRTGAVVRRSGTAFRAVDGPFAEAKEVVGGFLLISAADLDEAVALAREYSTCFDGVEEMSVEVRPLAEAEDLEPYR